MSFLLRIWVLLKKVETDIFLVTRRSRHLVHSLHTLCVALNRCYPCGGCLGMADHLCFADLTGVSDCLWMKCSKGIFWQYVSWLLPVSTLQWALQFGDSVVQREFNCRMVSRMSENSLHNSLQTLETCLKKGLWWLTKSTAILLYLCYTKETALED